MDSLPYRISAQEAARTLGITRATLYAYTSRGHLRSEPAPGRPRERLYYRDDVERLRERKEARRDPSKAAARGLHWGSPVLDSALTLIHHGRFWYRGQDAVRLAESATMEQVAELLWAAEPGERRLFTQPPALPPQRLARIRAFIADPFARLQMALPLAAAADPAACDLRPGPVRQTGARIVRMFAGILAARSWQRPIHLALQTAWAPRRPLAAEAIRQAVVLSADHELNISAFVARCAASAAASPYEVVAAALAALKGSRHGGASERVAALFAETATPRRARAVIAHRLRRGEGLPGFGHPLYPAGDPRAARLLQLAEASGNQQQCRLVRALSEAGSELLGDLPNLDFGLTALARTYALPESAPLLLFALGRTVGWIAHALEQYASGESMRPRARYIGIAPA